MGMLIHLHSQATTTPKVRAAIQASDEVGTVLAERFGVTPQTIYKWRKRDTVEDRSHTPHRLQTTLTPAQEVVAVALRKALLISLDDLLAVVREFLNPHVSRSGLDRCLRRHGVGNLRDLKAKAGAAQTQRLQGLRARLYPHRREVSAPDGRRDVAALPLRGHRPRDAMGFHPHLQGKYCGECSALSARLGASLSDAHSHDPYGQRKGVHRPALRPAQACPDRRARVRQALCRPGHRPPPDPAEIPSDKRYGRTV